MSLDSTNNTVVCNNTVFVFVGIHFIQWEKELVYYFNLTKMNIWIEGFDCSKFQRKHILLRWCEFYIQNDSNEFLNIIANTMFLIYGFGAILYESEPSTIFTHIFFQRLYAWRDTDCVGGNGTKIHSSRFYCCRLRLVLIICISSIQLNYKK